MPLMGSLYIGSSGLRTSQNALNTTAHNMANADTTGYVRQSVMLGNSRYNTIRINAASVSNQQVGMGVEYTKVCQTRSSFLDQAYRKEAARSAYYQSSATAMSEIETLMGEMYGVSFGASLGSDGGLQEAVEELKKHPTLEVNKKLLMQRADAFLKRANEVYKGLSDYQNNLNLQVKQKVDQINAYGKGIQALNDKIRKIQIGGMETPNDLLDARNQLLDQLSGLADIAYDEDAFGNVVVQLEGEQFITGGKVYEIELDKDLKTGFYTPFWKQNAPYTTQPDGSKLYKIDNAKVFNLQKEISFAKDTDTGHLKGLLLARGDHRANFADMEDPVHYKKNISQSLVMNAQAQFDQLVHNVATKFNQIFADAVKEERLKDPTSNYLCGSDGNPIQLFQKKATAGYDAAGNFIPEDSPLDPYKTQNLYTTTNLQINKELLQTPGLLNFVKGEDSVDHATLDKFVAAFSEELYTLNPTMTEKHNFVDYYAGLITQIGNTGQVLREIAANQEATVAEAEGARQQISGVSNDEELTNMIKYQNAYNASSRYINVISEMLEHIITSLGR